MTWAQNYRGTSRLSYYVTFLNFILRVSGVPLFDNWASILLDTNKVSLLLHVFLTNLVDGPLSVPALPPRLRIFLHFLFPCLRFPFLLFRSFLYLSAALLTHRNLNAGISSVLLVSVHSFFLGYSLAFSSVSFSLFMGISTLSGELHWNVSQYKFTALLQTCWLCIRRIGTFLCLYVSGMLPTCPFSFALYVCLC